METDRPNDSSYVTFFLTDHRAKKPKQQPNKRKQPEEKNPTSSEKPTKIRKPKGYQKALKAAGSAEETSTDALFLRNGGVETWFRYFLTENQSKESSGHFDGKAWVTQQLDNFEKTSVEFRISVAKGVKEALHAKAQSETVQPAERADSVQQSDDQRSISVQTAVTETKGNTELIPTAPDDFHSISDSPSRAVESDSQQDISAQTAELIKTVPNDAHFTITYPPASRLPNIFPRSLAKAIKRKRMKSGWSAGITMSFLGDLHADTRFGPMITLQTITHLADEFAMPLFGMKLRSVNGQRAQVLPTGALSISGAELTVRGCEREAILEVFGSGIDKAVKATAVYKDELARGEDRTDCVSMIIPPNINEGVVFNLLLEEIWAIKFKDALYGEYSF
ncbi:hypothetical protein CFAM422_011324 [Trichoderma lentiforme]|uniref:Uncharacterized protein n=1 Tax=Trichoderma lentiforme TaxID=1567552 RepID=A0A9P5C9V3_9HYPO|nr:hypothetical protein CFAM422_011324 [Trichoderma lentiforme]